MSAFPFLVSLDILRYLNNYTIIFCRFLDELIPDAVPTNQILVRTPHKCVDIAINFVREKFCCKIPIGK